MCTTGFILSLLGIFLLGLTSIFGLIFSICGLISAGKKKQKGKGKAIAGIIMALVMLISLPTSFFLLKDTLIERYEDMTGRTFPTRKIDVDFGEMFEEDGWVVLEDETCIRFNREDGTFNNYFSSQETSDFYMTGHYKLYSGKDALRFIKDEPSYAEVKDWIESDVGDDVEHHENKLIALVCDYEAFVLNGETQDDFDTQTVYFYGFYKRVVEEDMVFEGVEMYNVVTGTHFNMISEAQFYDYLAAVSDSADSAD